MAAAGEARCYQLSWTHAGHVSHFYLRREGCAAGHAGRMRELRLIYILRRLSPLASYLFIFI